MFIRKKKNKSGTTSISVVDKSSGRYKVVKSFGSSSEPEKIKLLYNKAKLFISDLKNQQPLIFTDRDTYLEAFLSNIGNSQIRTVGPERVFGKIYDKIGFNKIEEDIFRYLVISRLAYPGSKAKTVEYLYKYQGITISTDKIYRFLDRLSNTYKKEVEQISFNHSLERLGGNISVVFYDMTTLYFEASDEDELRITGYSKDGKHTHPQIYLGLLVGMEGLPLGYHIYKGNIYEGDTLIPTIQTFERRHNINKPMVIADSGLLSKKNIQKLESSKYKYILGGRIKNELKEIKDKINSREIEENQYQIIQKSESQRLIVTYSQGRAQRDKSNRQRGLKRLEKQNISGKLGKKHINNRGYNKYLKMEGDVKIIIDYEKFKADEKWDGLKGYITNSELPPEEIVKNYKYLWQIEKAFRISKTDLRIRPIYHRLANRIEAHICISFSAYSIFKELEWLLKKANSSISVNKASALTHTIYELEVELPESKRIKKILLNMDNEQQELIEIVNKYS